jgi:DnaJ-class molecular chaperone
MVTAEWYRQGAAQHACPCCGGHGRVTMGWPENVSWDENASPCSPCGGRGWVTDARTAPRTCGLERS